MAVLLAMVAAVTATAQAEGRAAVDSAWRSDVKTVQLYSAATGDDPTKATPVPLLTLDEGGRLALEFDVLGTESEALRWHVRHCDRHWVPDGLEEQEFLSGFTEGPVEEFDFSFTTLTDYVHYRCAVPDRYASFTHSGNYVLTVTTDDGSEVLLTRRFCVSEQRAAVRAEVGRPYDGVDIERRQEVDVTVSGDGLLPQYVEVTVQQNGRLDNIRSLEFSGYDGQALAYRYRQCNIFNGGNTFRWFDCSNLRAPMYNVVRIEEYGGEWLVLLKPDEDRSGKHFITETVLNGGMKTNVWDRNNPRLEADYAWVNISLPVSQPMLDGNVYVVGALTDWQLDSTALMEYNPTMRAYTKRLLLKQGYYAYQLLVLPAGRDYGTSRTARLEGDHRETPNRYTVYAYLRTPADRGDRLVAVGSVNAVR